MTPLQRVEAIDRHLTELLQGLPSLEQMLNHCLANVADNPALRADELMIDNRSLLERAGERLLGSQPFTLAPASAFVHHGTTLQDFPRVSLETAIENLCQDLRQNFHLELANFWAQIDSAGQSRQQRLAQLRKTQLLEEIELRLSDQTLDSDQAYAIRICLELPLPWQRQHLPLAQRPQVYRPLFNSSHPNWRSYLPGTLVIALSGPQGVMLQGNEAVGLALLCSFSHGIEAFASLDALHTELCERLDDPRQSTPMLELMLRRDDREQALQAERLRYDWFSDNVLEEQIKCVLDAQRARLSDTWMAAWNQSKQGDIKAFDAMLNRAMDLSPLATSKGLLATRYALLLEKFLPAWLRASSQQALTDIMHSLQALVAAIELAAAPGILTLEQFRQRNTLLDWTQERLRERLRQDLNLDIDPRDIRISVTLARRTGPLLNPLLPSAYMAVASRPQAGEAIELVNITYSLDELALLNIAWFDIDYWLSARVHRADGTAIAQLTPEHVKTLVRSLDAGSGYSRYLRTHLIDSANARWRRQAHININRARMRAEAVKARHAKHFIADTQERGYRWASVILQYPDSRWRATVEEHRISVRQLVIQGHTVQGVLLLTAEVQSITSFVLYTPDAPDRRPWREYRTVRELLRALRTNQRLRRYLVQRVPLADGRKIERLLLKGGLGPSLERPTIDGNWCEAYYLAEVQALLAAVDAGSRTTAEMNVQTMVTSAWLIVDLISLVLPHRALSALAFGRAAIDVWDGLQGLQTNDLETTLRHIYSGMAHLGEGFTSFAGSPVMRRALRSMPRQPPLPLPRHHEEIRPGNSQLRYRIDGVYGEGVYEKPSGHPGFTHYYVQDTHGRFYQVAYDGNRWRAIDPSQPDAYLKVPLKRRQDGEWVVDSPVHWQDGLPDLHQLFADCQPATLLTGLAVQGTSSVYQDDGQLYLQANGQQQLLRPHLLANRYYLQIPEALRGAVATWVVLRWENGVWRVRVRQTGRSSDWLALPGPNP